ncbi:C40 family peptidase [Lawsonibacter celer]|jgi:hypothetical protein|uniref:C40 family peptidase n=1 Tax=Lawsonibacter celer TaxID=2986526 RepID=UPI001648683A|nr:C40 family peptidase [Lawsonibacter celer]
MTRTRRKRRRQGSSLRPQLFLLAVLAAAIVLLLLPDLLRRPRPLPPPLPAGDAPRAVEEVLPEDLAGLRRAFVEQAASLVGKVGYFWGGKSDCIGWDERWGIPAVVTAAGCSDTGKSMPFGLDCSGYVCWAAVNAVGDRAAYGSVGDGVRAQWAACSPVEWADAQPGDLAFFPDLSHVGIVAGRDESGKLLVLHCSRSLGGVVCSPDGAAAGFTQLGRPALFADFL